MSDRIKGLIVALDNDYRDDDAEAIINAIRMVRGVSNVTTSVASSDDWMARDRVRMELHGKLLKVLHGD